MPTQHKKHQGHLIEVKVLDEKKETYQLLIDSVVAPHGKFDDGMFYLKDYAYQPNKDLLELAKNYLDHKAKVAKIRKEQSAREKGGKKV